METVFIEFLIVIGLSIVTVFADALIKQASMKNDFSLLYMLILGAVIYGLTAFGWFFVMKKIKLSTLGVFYGVSCVILVTLVSVFYFKEEINSFEILGIILAIVSLIILSRFA